MPASVQIHRAGEEDYDVLAEVMFDAVRNGPSEYSEVQRQAWMPERRSGDDWERRLSGQEILVARRIDHVVGFLSVTETGYIDLAFIRPRSQRQGVFRELYRQLEEHATRSGLTRLSVHASLMAQPAFAKMGFAIVAHQTVEVGSQKLARYEMEKHLIADLHD